MEEKIETSCGDVEQLNTKAEQFGIHFVGQDEYPKEISMVSDPSVLDKFGPELEWCLAKLAVTRGYGIAFPQVGVPYNIALIRFNKQLPFLLATNIRYTPFKEHGMRKVLEADYTINNGKTPLTIRRYNKILAEFDVLIPNKEKGYTIKKIKKVMRNPANSKTPPDAVIVQNIAEHMQPEYFKKYGN